MGMISYYALHSFKNQIKKLFKSWIVVFIVACALIGGLIGVGAGMLSEAAEKKNAVNEEAAVEEEESAEEEESITLPERMGVTTNQLVEAITGIVILIVFVFEVMNSSRNGSKIFLMADVNLLFSSPMKPQSVLMFRLLMQMGTMIAASFYLLFQLPNLIINMGLSPAAACALILIWLLTVTFGRLLQVLVYLVSSAHSFVKDNLNRIVYGILALAFAGFYVYWKQSGDTPYRAAVLFFAAPLGRWIPVWGWLKALGSLASEGQFVPGILCILAVAAAMAGLLVLIRRMKVDFYEDAMAKSEETAALLEAQREGKTARKKKDRSEKLKRDGMQHGSGANVFFFKSMYNRFRFAHFGFLTKTTETYLAAAIGIALFCRFVMETRTIYGLVLALGGMAFFRTMGNPLEQDTNLPMFVLIPEKTWLKLFWSVMGGCCNCLMDILLPLIIGPIILGVDPLPALAWIPLILSVDFFGTTVGAFINLSVPTSAGKTVKQIVQIMFIYFGLLPDAIAIAVCGVFWNLIAGAMIAAVFNIALGFVFLCLTPQFLLPGGDLNV